MQKQRLLNVDILMKRFKVTLFVFLILRIQNNTSLSSSY